MAARDLVQGMSDATRGTKKSVGVGVHLGHVQSSKQPD